MDECDKVVHESVAAHRIADVKVGSFFFLAAWTPATLPPVLCPDTTYSVGFDYKNFNETNYAAELSDKLGIKNVRKMITADEFFDALPDIQYHMDEPHRTCPACRCTIWRRWLPRRSPSSFRARAPTSCLPATSGTRTPRDALL